MSSESGFNNLGEGLKARLSLPQPRAKDSRLFAHKPTVEGLQALRAVRIVSPINSSLAQSSVAAIPSSNLQPPGSLTTSTTSNETKKIKLIRTSTTDSSKLMKSPSILFDGQSPVNPADVLKPKVSTSSAKATSGATSLHPADNENLLPKPILSSLIPAVKPVNRDPSASTESLKQIDQQISNSTVKKPSIPGKSSPPYPCTFSKSIEITHETAPIPLTNASKAAKLNAINLAMPPSCTTSAAISTTHKSAKTSECVKDLVSEDVTLQESAAVDHTYISPHKKVISAIFYPVQL